MLAWEWLRRQPEYRSAALRSGARQAQLSLGVAPEQPPAARWGLHLFEDPCLPAVLARPMWRSERHPLVLRAMAEAADADADAFVLERVGRLARVAGGAGVERLLLSDGWRSVRMDVRGTSLLNGPVRLTYELAGIAAAREKLRVLRRFLALASANAFSRPLHSPPRGSRRQVLLLRAADALREGADQRAIAAGLLSGRAAEARWRVNAPSLRSQVQRLVRGARQMSDGAFWTLLL
jgi:hypothetical protein